MIGAGDRDGKMTPPFMYTIGNHGRGHPELLLVGIAQENFIWHLNELMKIQRDRNKGFEAGEIVSLGGQHPVRLVDATEEAIQDYTFGVSSLYQTRDYAVLQVLIPDPKGRFPDHPECEAPYGDLPILKRAN